MNNSSNELNSFEKWVVKKRSIWFHIIVGYLSCFIWLIIYFYCKYKSDKIIREKEEKLQREKEEIAKRKSRKKTELVFDKRIKVRETSHPSRQKLLKVIYTILENSDTPDISASIGNKSIELFYCDIDDDLSDDHPIGVIKEDFCSEIKKYYDSPDYDVFMDYEVEQDDDIYNLYAIIKIYN